MALDIEQARPDAVLHAEPSAAVPKDELAQGLHPAIYETIAGLVIIFAASIWGFFVPGSRNYLLTAASGFALTAFGLPYQLWRVRNHGHDPRDMSLSPLPLREWLHKDIEVWGARMRGSDAAAAILLPLAAGAFGMLCFAIVFHTVVG